MEWEDDAYVLSARAHGESGAIVDLLTAEHGRFAAHVAGGGSRTHTWTGRSGGPCR